MRNFFFGMVLTLASSSAMAYEVVDGHCAMNVLEMERATHVDASSSRVKGKAKEFYDKSLKIAMDHYKKSPVFDKMWTVEILKASVLFSKEVGNMLGVKITLHMGTDEDQITYYFFKDGVTDRPKLKMYLHDEQSAMSYWTCEH